MNRPGIFRSATGWLPGFVPDCQAVRQVHQAVRQGGAFGGDCLGKLLNFGYNGGASPLCPLRTTADSV